MDRTVRIKLVLQYNGTQYKGWQRQKSCVNTVQQQLEEALTKICNQEITVHASGRTDAGVHALGQVVHFDTQTYRELDRYVSGCNHFLPATIRVLDACIVEQDFHARFSSIAKTYCYKFYVGKECAILHDKAMHVCVMPNLQWMEHACDLLVGNHDFASFMGAGVCVHSTKRTVIRCGVKSSTDSFTGQKLIDLTITANGFLYNMVRRIAGLVLRIGLGEMNLQAVQWSLENKDKKYTTLVAPSCGLYLTGVQY
ncbi:MAG: tRNA pseudouridine(38-40) synthase TruA [Clostridiales bacterium]|nr:tRNA pseudouridine(38-40) synthase TruA [Clostridiales bacterium]